MTLEKQKASIHEEKEVLKVVDESMEKEEPNRSIDEITKLVPDLESYIFECTIISSQNCKKE
ncbi:hypothetical protein J1N35_005193 [Gossypium stocksii]|uniref:Uncharacterized protein n=1 Tax=Gossypium stocksii TaxID=47602 RepID=A0A9D3WEW2_9ROSI|nr:hypothetical protein J1N35_005193 [Gossypium stocksii]